MPIRRFDAAVGLGVLNSFDLLAATEVPYLVLHVLFHLTLILIVTPHVRDHLRKYNVVSYFQDEEQPKNVHALQARQQGEGDVLTDPAFVLLGIPAELERANGSEGGECCFQDDKIDVVSQVDPDPNEHGEIREDEGGVEVVEGFGRLKGRMLNLPRKRREGEELTYRKEEIANVMCNINRHTHVREVKPIT